MPAPLAPNSSERKIVKNSEGSLGIPAQVMYVLISSERKPREETCMSRIKINYMFICKPKLEQHGGISFKDPLLREKNRPLQYYREEENVASIAWKGIVKAMKTPRLRKPKRNRKSKSRTTEITTELNTQLFTEIDIFPETESYKMKLTIPILHQPEWKSMLHWRHLQRPNLIETAKTLEQKGNVKINGIFQYEGFSPDKQRAIEEHDENEFGILYFI
nr:uncharacterized protein LOC113402864 [Vanessa tameamea]